MAMKIGAPDFWKKVAEAGSLPTTTTPVSASTNIADFWKKVSDGGSLPTTTTPFSASGNLPDFWAKVATAGAIPTTSTLVAFSTEADYWAYVAAHGVMPISVGNVYANARDLWRAIVTGASGGVSTYTISGTVYDADGSTAVQGATIALGALTATSAANGTYTISNVPAGTSGSMTCTKTGYSWTAITVSAMSGNLTAQNYINKWWAVGGLAASVILAYQPIGAADLAASYINLANPGTYNAAPGTAPTWNATDGWIADGAKLLIANGLTLADSYDYSLFGRFSNASAGLFCGASADGTRGFYLYPNSGGSGHYYNNGGFRNVAGDKTSGVMGFAGKNCYFNGAAEGAIAGTNTLNVYTFGILAGTSGGLSSYTGNLQALILYTGTLTGPQVTALTNAMAALP